MISLSTHVLDTATGDPAAGMHVSLERVEEGGAVLVGTQVTDDDGRVSALGESLESGIYRLRFATGDYGNAFYPEVVVQVRLDGAKDHYHVPLLLSPFGYSTYRGS